MRKKTTFISGRDKARYLACYNCDQNVGKSSPTEGCFAYSLLLRHKIQKSQQKRCRYFHIPRGIAFQGVLEVRFKV